MTIDQLKNVFLQLNPVKRLYKLINNSEEKDKMLDFNISSAINISKETGITKMLTSGENDFKSLVGYSGAIHYWKGNKGGTARLKFSNMIKSTIDNLHDHDQDNIIQNILFINHTCQSTTHPRIGVDSFDIDTGMSQYETNPLLDGVDVTNNTDNFSVSAPIQVQTKSGDWKEEQIGDVKIGDRRGRGKKRSREGGKRRKIKKRLCSKKKLRKKMICHKGTKKKHKKLHKLTKKLKIKLTNFKQT